MPRVSRHSQQQKQRLGLAHSEACRKRIEAHLAEDPRDAEQVKRSEERKTEYKNKVDESRQKRKQDSVGEDAEEQGSHPHKRVHPAEAAGSSADGQRPRPTEREDAPGTGDVPMQEQTAATATRSKAQAAASSSSSTSTAPQPQQQPLKRARDPSDEGDQDGWGNRTGPEVTQDVLMSLGIKQHDAKVTVSEIYSPPRVTAAVRTNPSLGFTAGFALDLTTVDENGNA